MAMNVNQRPITEKAPASLGPDLSNLSNDTADSVRRTIMGLRMPSNAYVTQTPEQTNSKLQSKRSVFKGNK